MDITTNCTYRYEQRYIHFCIIKFQIIEQLYTKKINESPELWSLWKIRIYESFNKLSLANRHLDKANKMMKMHLLHLEEEGTPPNSFNKAIITAIPKPDKRHHKKRKWHISIHDDYRCKNPQQNISKANLAIH